MSIKKSIFKIFNGTSWDEYYHKTSADQVVYTKPDGTASTAQAELDAQNSALKDYVKIVEIHRGAHTIKANQAIQLSDAHETITGYKFIGTIGGRCSGDTGAVFNVNSHWVFNSNTHDITVDVYMCYMYIRSA